MGSEEVVGYFGRRSKVVDRYLKEKAISRTKPQG
jgi:hypothetical protein